MADARHPSPRMAETLNGAAIITLADVHKRYRLGHVEVVGLAGVSLAIRRNSFTVVAGPSGSGKTTLLNLIGCIDRPSAGRVTACGADIAQLSDNALADLRASNIGFIFQSFNLVPVLTAAENVEMALSISGMRQSERKERARAILDAVGLADRAGSRPDALSGGQRQRVAIARALVKEPQVVLADEPTANLDSHTGAQIIALMRDMQARLKTTFVFSSHDPQLIGEAEDMVTIRDGRIEDVRRAA